MDPEYKLAVLQQHLFRDFDYHTDKAMRIFPRGAYGPSFKLLNSSPEMILEKSKKMIILDSDGVVNKPDTDSPTAIFAKYLITNNDFLRQKERQVLWNMMMLEKDDDPRQYAENLNYLFRKSELTENLYSNACDYAADNFSIAPNLERTIERVKNMGYIVAVLTASPYQIVKRYSRRVPVDVNHVKASTFHFRDGIFEKMDLNLSESRMKSKEVLMEDYVKANYTVEIIVDDNPVTGKKVVKGGWDSINFWISDTDPKLSNVSLNMSKLRHNFLPLEDKLRSLERGIAVVMTMSEKDYKAAIQMSHDSVDYGTKALNSSGYEFHQMKEKFVDRMDSYFKTMDFRFPSRATGMERRVRDLKFERNDGIAKSKIKNIVEIFSKKSIEAQMPIELAA